MKRELPCGVCGKQVTLSRERLAYLSQSNQTPLCEQCRRFFLQGTARVSQLHSETRDTSLGLARKVGRGAKMKRGLESLPLKRLDGGVCDTAGEVDE